MKNVYQIGSGDLTFDIIERIINENLKLELAPEAKDRIQKCRDYLDKKIKESDVPLYGITTDVYKRQIMGPQLFDYGYGPFRWVCLSGKKEDLIKTDHAAME